MLKINYKSAAIFALIFLGIIVIVGLAVFVRSSSLKYPTVLDYDPWWYFRHAKEIVDNNYKMPAWDILSYYPPGRPNQPYNGWSYTIAYLYRLASSISPSITLVQIAKISPLIMVSLTVIVSYLFGSLIFKNKIAGLLLALFSTLTPTFISVSMGGYSESKSVVVFYTFFSFLAYFLLLNNANKKLKSIPFYILAVAVNLMFIFNWGAGWLPSLVLFTVIPAFFVYKLFEEVIFHFRFKFNWKYAFEETKPVAIPLLITFLILNIIGYFLGFSNMLASLIGGLQFTGIGGEPLIVNISVAELQKINIFSLEGLMTIATRVGLLPTLLTSFGFLAFLIYKIYKKQKINPLEIFLIVWVLVSFYLIATGIRFALLFSIASSLTAAYMIANIFQFVKGRNNLLIASISAILFVFLIAFVSDGIKTGYDSSSGLAISQNWYNALDWLKANANSDSLVATWWDPGHIIAGYTGLKVHADGAHCGYCIPYNHNVRIVDMGRLMSTDNETESIQILQKYTHLTPEQCAEVKQTYPTMPADACKDVSDVYVLATNDLIGKYYWMSCFGTFDMKLWNATDGKKWSCDGRNFIQMPLTSTSQGYPVYSLGDNTISLLQNGTQVLAILNAPSQGIRNALISNVTYFQNGVEFHSSPYTNNTLSGLIWVDPSFRGIFFMDPQIRDSIFTKMFFFQGKGLDKYELVYQNSEVKIFKAHFG
ncbi:MAG: hypothetical protein HYW23_03735 [Candidatus Aenigmarchaeota archaeon]|nr:hypothetical protein [Candidatus Aenigmarchaeota archaeon]